MSILDDASSVSIAAGGLLGAWHASRILSRLMDEIDEVLT